MNALKRLFIGLILVALAAPIVVVLGVSLNGPQALLFPPQDPSLRWYGELFRQSDWLVPLRNSLVIAAIASLLAVLVALPLALHVWSRSRALSTRSAHAAAGRRSGSWFSGSRRACTGRWRRRSSRTPSSW